MTIYALLDEYRATAQDTSDQGKRFEHLMQAFFQTDPLDQAKFSNVWLWQDWPGRHGRPDCGIDLVAPQADSDDLWAIQCKFWDRRVTKEDLDSFFTESGKRPFTQRLIVATSALSKHAEEALEGQWVDTHTLTLDDLDRSAIDWGQFSRRNRGSQLLDLFKSYCNSGENLYESTEATFFESLSWLDPTDQEIGEVLNFSKLFTQAMCNLRLEFPVCYTPRV